jgi:hypothetical protein
MVGVFSIEVKSVAETNATPQAFFVGNLCGNQTPRDCKPDGFSFEKASFKLLALCTKVLHRPATPIKGCRGQRLAKSVIVNQSEVNNMSAHKRHRHFLPGGDAESALQSAARILVETASASGGAPAGQRRVFQGCQERDLGVWAKESGYLLVSEEALARYSRCSERHRTRQGLNVYHKATYPGNSIILPIDAVMTETNEELASLLEALV